MVIVTSVRLGQAFADENRVIEQNRHAWVPLLHELDVIAGFLPVIGPTLPIGWLVRTIMPKRPDINLAADLMRIMTRQITAAAATDIADIDGRPTPCRPSGGRLRQFIH